MKATQEFFDQLEQEIKNGTLENQQMEEASLPPIPTIESRPDTPDYTALRQILGEYQQTITQLYNQIESQTNAQTKLIEDLASASESLKQKNREIEEQQHRLNKLESRWENVRDILRIAYDEEEIVKAESDDDSSQINSMVASVIVPTNEEQAMAHQIAQLKEKLKEADDPIYKLNKIFQEAAEKVKDWGHSERSTFATSLLVVFGDLMSDNTKFIVGQLKNVSSSASLAMADNNGIAANTVNVRLSKEGENKLLDTIITKSK